MHAFEKDLLHHLRNSALIAPGSRGLVMVSGGTDSVALLRGLCALRRPLRLELAVLHADHGLRPESAAEAVWVHALGSRLACPVHLVQTTELAQRSGGVQAAARAWRLAEAVRLAGAEGADWVATAHQRDDQQETLLLKLLRGAHLSRLQGMAARQGRFVRPLLPFTRATLRSYLLDLGQDWLEDPSNNSPKYTRNRVRQELLPLMNTLAGGRLADRLDTLSEDAAELAAWLDAQPLPPANDPDGQPPRPPHWLEVAGLLAAPAPARGALVQRFIAQRLPGQVPARLIRQALALLEKGTPHWRLHLPGRRVLRRQRERLVLEARNGAA